MRRSPELKPNLWDALTAGVVVVLAVACAAAFWGRGGGTEQLTMVVSIDGAEVERLNLDGGQGQRVYTGNGYTLTAAFSPEGVTVTEADCPTQDCVHSGTIRRGGQSIVCLPGRIIIQLVGGPADRDGPDVIIG